MTVGRVWPEVGFKLELPSFWFQLQIITWKRTSSSQGEFLGLVPAQCQQRYLHRIHTMEAPFSRPSRGLNGLKQWVPMQTILTIVHISLFPVGWEIRSKRRRKRRRSLRMRVRLPLGVRMIFPIVPILTGPRSRHGWGTIGRKDWIDNGLSHHDIQSNLAYFNRLPLGHFSWNLKIATNNN